VAQSREEILQQETMDFKNSFTSESGKRVLQSLSRECYENAVTFVRNEPESTAFNEGKRYIMLHIRRILARDIQKDKPEQAVN